jgi:tmRNA-binding protein
MVRVGEGSKKKEEGDKKRGLFLSFYCLANTKQKEQEKGNEEVPKNVSYNTTAYKLHFWRGKRKSDAKEKKSNRKKSFPRDVL